MPADRIPEVEIGRAVVSWLRADEWDVWQEVGYGTAGKVCDIVAKRGPVVHAIECKSVANLAVLEQALGWESRAHLVSIAVPKPRGSFMYERVARAFGVGVLWVGREWRPGGSEVLSVVHWQKGAFSRVLEKHWSRPLSEYLTPERMSWPAEAGNNLGHRYTPFRETCDELRRIVEAEPGITMRAAVERMRRHHYHDDKAARGALMQWVRHGRVRGVAVAREYEGRAIPLYPSEHPNAYRKEA